MAVLQAYIFILTYDWKNDEEKSKPVFYCYKVFYYPRDILGDEFVDDKKI